MIRRRVRPVALLLAGAAALLAVPAFLAVRRWRRPPNVVVLVADTLRADRLGAYGNPHGLTPFLDALAARGTLFRHAYSTSSWTCPAVASLLTSRYPSQHHVNDFDARLAADEVTLAERLAERRYLSVGFSANLRLTTALGYGQGFVDFFPFASRRKVTAERLTRKAGRWLDVAWNSRARRPLFAYYQFMETHAPYDPDGEPHGHGAAETALRRRLGLSPGTGARAAALNRPLTALRWGELSDDDVAFLETRYDAEVALLDARLRALFDELERRGVLDRAVIVFTADHGEEFRDHGELLHGSSLFDEQLHVPLIVVGPGWPAGRVVDDNVSLVDVAPTLLAQLGLPPEPRFEGRSLLPLLAGKTTPADVLAEQPPPARSPDPGRHSMALIRGVTKLIVPRGNAPAILYDLAADPHEQHPDPPALATEIPVLRAAADRAVNALAARAGTPEQGQVDERTRARLRALGYAN